MNYKMHRDVLYGANVPLVEKCQESVDATKQNQVTVQITDL